MRSCTTGYRNVEGPRNSLGHGSVGHSGRKEFLRFVRDRGIEVRRATEKGGRVEVESQRWNRNYRIVFRGDIVQKPASGSWTGRDGVPGDEIRIGVTETTGVGVVLRKSDERRMRLRSRLCHRPRTSRLLSCLFVLRNSTTTERKVMYRCIRKRTKLVTWTN